MIWPATAEADLEIAVQDLPSTGHTLLARDTSGEANDVAIGPSDGSVISVFAGQLPPGPRWLISDAAGIASVPPECQYIDAPFRDYAYCDPAPFQIVAFELGGGDDSILAYGAFQQNRFVDQGIALGPGNDHFEGGLGDHFVNGGPGRDSLLGGPLIDNVVGGPGPDRIDGGAGTDTMYGRGGRDKLRGARGEKDLMVGGRGSDLCTGEPKDLVVGCEKVRVR